MLPEIIAENRLAEGARDLQPSAAPTTRRRLAWILVCALAVRVGLLWASSGAGVRIADERSYHQIATSIADGNGFGWGPRLLTSIRPPLYPSFIAAIWSATDGHALLPIRIAQTVIALLSALLVFRIARHLYDDTTALVAFSLVAFYPSLLLSGVLILSETLFLFWLLLSIWALIQMMRDSSLLWATAAGVFLALAALTRSVVWPFVFVLVPFVWFVSQGTVRRRTVACAALLLGYATILAPWAVRNTRLQGTLTIVDTMSGINLLTGNYEYTPEDRMWDAVSIVGSHG